MTSQYPVKIHVVVSISIFHHKTTVLASNGKLTCLLLKLKQATPFYYRLEIKPGPTGGETILTNYFLLVQNTISCQKNELTVSRTTNKFDTSTRSSQDSCTSTQSQTTNDHHLQILEGPTPARSQILSKSYKSHR